MNDLWPGICAAAALIALLVCIIRYKVHAFIALVLVSLGLGFAAGLPPARIVDAFNKGIADILREVLMLLALGAMLGRMLEASGAAELIARRIINAFGDKHTSFAILLAAYLIGIPILFNVAFLVLIPIVWRLQSETNKSLLFYLMPLTLALGITHSLVPPHPGIVGAVTNIAGKEQAGRVMVETIIFGIALSFPLALLGWFGPGRWWAHRQFVPAPEQSVKPEPEAQTKDDAQPVAKSFALAITIVLAPLVLSLLGFGATLLADIHRLPGWMTNRLFDPDDLPRYLRWLNHSTLDWLQFLGKPTIALLVPTALAFWCYGIRRGWSQARLAKLTSDALVDVGGMLFLFGAAGGFKEIIGETGVGDYIKEQVARLPISLVAVGFLVAALVRVALGSATASILAASALLGKLAGEMQGRETLLVLAVACGVTVATQPADSGFWMLKEYGNLSPRQVMLGVNGCRFAMALTGLGILLLAEAFLVY
jgi:Gnt-I system low-affinity gluconate transporter